MAIARAAGTAPAALLRRKDDSDECRRSVKKTAIMLLNHGAAADANICGVNPAALRRWMRRNSPDYVGEPPIAASPGAGGSILMVIANPFLMSFEAAR